MPEGSSEYSIYTADGKTLHQRNRMKAGERVFLDPLVHGHGMYFIQVRTAKRIYVGKVVLMR
jgi:hypothetical protein